MKNKYLLIFATVLLGTIGYAQPDRMVLVETFTSSTCPPCAPGNVSLEAILAEPANTGKTVSVKYQMNWPSPGDPYYTPEGGNRKNFYSVAGVPHTMLDAEYDGGPSNLTQGDFDAQYAIAPSVDLKAYYQVNESTQTVDVQVDVESFADLPPSARLYVAIFEYTTDNNVGTNGETVFEHVMKKMIGGGSGNVIGVMSVGEIEHHEFTHTFMGSYVLPPDATDPIDHATEHSIEEFSDLGVAVWMQSAITKEVYQATYAGPGYSPLSLEENAESVTSATVYPNPTTNNAAIAFHSTEVQDVTIEVYNALGQQVYSQALSNIEIGRIIHEFSTSELVSGIYTVSVRSNKGTIEKKLSVR